MRKVICAIMLCAIQISSVAPAWSQAANEATIEPETKARLVLQTQLSSKLNEVGDTITAVLNDPIYVDNKLVLPRGTEFHGRITEVAPAGRGQKNGKLSIIFEKVAMPWGEENVSVVLTSIDDWDNDDKLKADDEGKVKGKRSGKRTVENTRDAGTIGGAAGIGTVLVGGPAAAGGAMILGSLLGGVLLTKGGEVRVQPGAVFRIKFVKPLTLPVIQQASPGPRPIQQDAPERDSQH